MKAIRIIYGGICFPSGILLTLYFCLWFAIPILFIVGILLGLPTEGWSFSICMLAAQKCYYLGTTFWEIGLIAWGLTVATGTIWEYGMDAQ